MRTHAGIFTKPSVLLAALWLGLSLMLTLVHVRMIDIPSVAGQMELHAQIVSHSAPAPYQYRLLQPLLVEAMLKVSGQSSPAAFIAAYALLRFLALFTICLCFFSILRLICTHTASVLGVLLLLVVIPFTYWGYYYQPTSIIELAAFALALWFTAKRQLFPLLLVVFLGSFNRETMVFISAIWVLWWMKEQPRQAWLGGTLLFAGWAAPFIGLRALFPVTQNLLDVSHYVRVNLANPAGMLDVFCMTVPWFAWLLRRRVVPVVYRRLLWVWLGWIALHFFTAQWWEVR